MKSIKNKEKIFDSEEIKDLPEYMQEKILKSKKISRVKSIDENILSLFEIKPSLSVDEVMIGLYRKYKIEKSRQALGTILHHLKFKNFVSRDDDYNWRKNEHISSN